MARNNDTHDEAHDILWMRQALELARQAGTAGEVPVGAILIQNGTILAQGMNQRERTGLATHHAEILAIEEACRKLRGWRLLNCTLYVTLEPCPMCAGALINSRLSRLVYGAADPKSGAVDSLYQLLNDPRLNHRVKVTGGLLQQECATLLQSFFLQRRTKLPT